MYFAWNGDCIADSDCYGFTTGIHKNGRHARTEITAMKVAICLGIVVCHTYNKNERRLAQVRSVHALLLIGKVGKLH